MGQKGTTALSLQQKKTPLNRGRFALLIHGKSHLVLLTSHFCFNRHILNFISLIEVFLSVLCHWLHLESPSFFPLYQFYRCDFTLSFPCDGQSRSHFLLVYFKGQGPPRDSVEKIPPAMQETQELQFDPWSWEDVTGRKLTQVFLPWKKSWTEEAGGL